MIDLRGKRFGKLFVPIDAEYTSDYRWKCICDCETVEFVISHTLRSGKKIACVACAKSTKGIHGLSGTVEYEAWVNMKQRCYNPGPRHDAYENISVWDKWINNPKSFCEYVGKRPSNQHSLDRWPNPYGNYEPGNVRWATSEEQANNRTTNHSYTINGETRTITQWARIYNIHPGTVFTRLKLGMTIVDALILPNHQGSRSRG